MSSISAERFFWLQELSTYFPYARVLSFGWSGNDLKDPAYSLLADIAQSRRGLQVAYPNLFYIRQDRRCSSTDDCLQSSRLIFVAHSIGGLVVKQVSKAFKCFCSFLRLTPDYYRPSLLQMKQTNTLRIEIFYVHSAGSYSFVSG